MSLCLQLPDGILAPSEQSGEQTAGKAGPETVQMFPTLGLVGRRGLGWQQLKDEIA